MLEHTIRGEGQLPVVLLHGFLGSGRNLATVARRWGHADPRLRFVLPDLTGHGDSPPLPADAGLDRLAADVLELGAALQLEPLRLVGHSLGGRVALAALRAEPERIANVVVLDITPSVIPPGEPLVLDRLLAADDRPESRAAARQFLLEGGLPESIVEWLLMNLVSKPDGSQSWRIDRPLLAALGRRANADDLWDVVRTHGERLMVVRAGRSPYLTDDDQKRLEDAGATVHTLEEAGHFVHVDALDELVSLLSEHSTRAWRADLR